MSSVREINRKNLSCCFFDDMINIKNCDLSYIKINNQSINQSINQLINQSIKQTNIFHCLIKKYSTCYYSASMNLLFT